MQTATAADEPRPVQITADYAHFQAAMQQAQRQAS